MEVESLNLEIRKNLFYSSRQFQEYIIGSNLILFTPLNAFESVQYSKYRSRIKKILNQEICTKEIILE